MGIEIVKASIVNGKRLSGNAYKVLIAMSVQALDRPSNGRPASLYWGGWDALAVALGHTDAARDGQGHKAVKRAVKELRDKGHLTPMTEAARGTRQSYMLHPGGLGKGAQDGPVKGAQSDPVKGAQNGSVRGPKEGPPRTHIGPSADLEQDVTTPVPTQVQTARDDEKPQGWMRGHKLVGHEYDPAEDGSGCWTCGLREGNRKAHPPLRVLRGA